MGLLSHAAVRVRAEVDRQARDSQGTDQGLGLGPCYTHITMSKIPPPDQRSSVGVRPAWQQNAAKIALNDNKRELELLPPQRRLCDG